ncbi:hypothetical protein SAMN02745751_02969 [Dethiosulfatibacter aminovorans DSM 17477]|uniref:Uncharacterized protein n=1 Tax=Dethiosulfatibacter aminovorans DSM 17477 TaxID=1121476 RepID=A0A1M6KSN4_9FIRM|nr:hypothetical protein SAMN02745751_02969 [Dethiosulfatibacter aminovorans DSM 17477]
MDQIHDIRYRFYEKGENISQIASVLTIIVGVMKGISARNRQEEVND